jgi:dipeptidyl aminopeptidase/acylaminoacyl peptidase
MHADGTDVTRIAVGEAPAWSPDGKQLAYIGVDANHQRQLVVAAPDGNASGARPIAAVGSCRLAQAPAWSPDGRWLAFESCPNGTLVELYLIPSAGGRPIRIALNASVDGGPDWQPVKPSTGIVARFIFAQRACATQPGRATVTVADAQNRPLAAATVTITGGVRIKPAHGVTNANGRAVLALRAVLHRPHRLTLTARVTASGRPALDRRLTLPACSS